MPTFRSSHPDPLPTGFQRLWAAQTVSMFGSQVSRLALPLIAVVTLDASPFEVGLVAAVETAPYPLFGLAAGVIADRIRRRRILMVMDAGRVITLGVVPLLWWMGWLNLQALVLVAFLTGVQSVFFDIAVQSYLPFLVGRNRLVDANSKVALSGAAARVAGPSIAGGIIELLAAPVAIGVDALTFLLSGILIARIPDDEPLTGSGRTAASAFRDVREGVSYVWRHPFLRPIAACTATFNLFVGVFSAIFVLFAVRDLGVSAGLLGVIIATGGLGVFIGARVVDGLQSRLGTGRALIASILVGAVGALAVAIAPTALFAAFWVLIVGRIVYNAGTVMYDIIQVSLRQSVTPDELLGRMNATIRVAIWGTLPVGSLIGGLAGDVLGVRLTIVLASAGMVVAGLWLLTAAVRTLTVYPTVQPGRHDGPPDHAPGHCSSPSPRTVGFRETSSRSQEASDG